MPSAKSPARVSYQFTTHRNSPCKSCHATIPTTTASSHPTSQTITNGTTSQLSCREPKTHLEPHFGTQTTTAFSTQPWPADPQCIAVRLRDKLHHRPFSLLVLCLHRVYCRLRSAHGPASLLALTRRVAVCFVRDRRGLGKASDMYALLGGCMGRCVAREARSWFWSSSAACPAWTEYIAALILSQSAT